MTPWATSAQLLARVGAGRLERLGASTADQETALASATELAASYLARRYAEHELPASAADCPAPVRDAVVDLAFYNLLAAVNLISEEDQRRQEDALRYLRDLAAGRASLRPRSPAPVENLRPEPLAAKPASAQVFGGPSGAFKDW